MDPRQRWVYLMNAQAAAPRSRLTRFLTGAVGIVAFAIALVVGGALLLVALAVGLALSVVFALRIWWWRRTMRQTEPHRRPESPDSGGGSATLEGEFREIDRNDHRD